MVNGYQIFVEISLLFFFSLTLISSNLLVKINNMVDNIIEYNINAIAKSKTLTKVGIPIKKNTTTLDFLGWISYNEKLVDGDLQNVPFFKTCPEILMEGREIVERLVER